MADHWNSEVVWEPSPEVVANARITAYMRWLPDHDGPECSTYEDLWAWSVEEPAAFWSSVRDYFSLQLQGESEVLDRGTRSPTGMPGARWFVGATCNYARTALLGEGADPEDVAIIARSQSRAPLQLSRVELRSEVSRVRRGLVSLGIGKGDRVAAYAPNIPETLVMFLAAASIGAVWSSCAPEFGTRSVLDRLSQIDPKVLLVVDGYQYGARSIDRRAEVAAIRAGLRDDLQVVHIGYLDPHTSAPEGSIRYEELDGAHDPGFAELPFDHPLYVLYSSGTTGLPKAIVHGHGGILLEHHKALALHGDLGSRDRFFWFTTTGWMMWNLLVSGLNVGAAVVLFDGDPGHATLDTLWDLAETTAVSSFGVSAPFLDACRRAGLRPGADHDLSRLRILGSTGAPLSADGYRWVADHVGDVQLASISGGTDVCTAFVGAVPLREVRAGIIPCRYLGADVAAFDSNGSAVVGVEGELVVRTPMPSMPVSLWGDSDGSRLRNAYFEHFPDTWYHGDWITLASDGSCVISGRSDATLNRGGVRLGTADFYAVVEGFDEVVDSLVVHLDGRQDGGELIAFVQMEGGSELDDELEDRLRRALRSELSPRHVPDRFESVVGIPRTLSGKKLEVPVKRILQGTPVEQALTRGALANPEVIDAYVAMVTTS